MNQLTFDDIVATDAELILCPLTPNYHWIRITEGQTPSRFVECVQFRLDGYDYLYERTESKDKILSAFEGDIKTVPFVNQ